MQSRLFRRETGRTLRNRCGEIIDVYIESRYSWLDAFGCLSREGMRETIEVLADGVERGDRGAYRDFTSAYLEDLIGSGMPPVAVLAAGDLFEQAVLRIVTGDQQDLLLEMFDVERAHRQSVVYDRCIALEARGA